MDQNRSKLVARTGLMSNKANQTWPKNVKKFKRRREILHSKDHEAGQNIIPT